MAGTAQSQEVLYLDRSSFGKAVLSQTESTVGDIQLELSIGDYKNEPIINYSDRSDLVQFGRSVGRLDVLYDKGISSCTAFIVSKQYILTNYHCSLGILENARIDATRIDAITFVAGYTQTGIEEGTRKYTVIPTPIEASKELDYAVLEVVGDPSQEYGELKLASLAPQSGDPFWIIGHPMGEGQRVSREKCRASSPAVSAGKLLHTCDTLPGNSGSPVIDVSLRQVVALHHAGSQKDSVNFAILMSEILENSTVLAAYKAPDAVPKAEPKTAANSACDALYSATADTKACYAYDVYLKSCSAHSLAPLARGYVEEFCQPQETAKVEKTCDDDQKLCSTDQLCGQSLTFISGKADWRTDNASYVTEAKRRGLSCGVMEVLATPKKTCSENVKYCDGGQLCTQSVTSQNGRKVWDTKSLYGKYVTEAKRRGLSCGVDTAAAIKTAFKNQSVLKRKQIQYALKKLNYYKGSIDALYGSSTEKALINFAKAKGLDINSPQKVFESGLSQVSVPSSFGSAKPKKTIADINAPCYRNYKNCTPDQLCRTATSIVGTASGGRKTWLTSSYPVHVSEAKRRGLTCGVK